MLIGWSSAKSSSFFFNFFSCVCLCVFRVGSVCMGRVTRCPLPPYIESLSLSSSLSQNLELAWHPAISKGVSSLHSLALGWQRTTPNFAIETLGDLNSVPQACTANAVSHRAKSPKSVLRGRGNMRGSCPFWNCTLMGTNDAKADFMRRQD